MPGLFINISPLHVEPCYCARTRKNWMGGLVIGNENCLVEPSPMKLVSGPHEPVIRLVRDSMKLVRPGTVAKENWKLLPDRTGLSNRGPETPTTNTEAEVENKSALTVQPEGAWLSALTGRLAVTCVMLLEV